MTDKLTSIGAKSSKALSNQGSKHGITHLVLIASPDDEVIL